MNVTLPPRRPPAGCPRPVGAAVGVLGVALLGSLVHAQASFIPVLHAGLVIATAAFVAAAIITFYGIDRRHAASPIGS
jgi:hypothetical protein